MSDSNLKPCPFCGGSNVSTYEVKGSFSTLCVGCGGEGPEEKSEAEAISAWNKRPPSARDSEVERLREALEHIVRRLQMDIDDGSRPDQWSMEDLVRKANSALSSQDKESA